MDLKTSHCKSLDVNSCTTGTPSQKTNNDKALCIALAWVVLIMPTAAMAAVARLNPPLAHPAQQTASQRNGQYPQTEQETDPHEKRALPKRKGAVADFYWLLGRWKGKVSGNLDDLTFINAEEGSLAGIAIVHREDRIYTVELVHFVQTVDGITIYLRHFSSELQLWEKTDPIALKLASIRGNTSNFQGTFNNQPYRWTITKTGVDSFTIHSEMHDENGESEMLDFSFARAK